MRYNLDYVGFHSYSFVGSVTKPLSDEASVVLRDVWTDEKGIESTVILEIREADYT